MAKLAVVAVGGNSLILDGLRGTIPEQVDAALVTGRHIAALVEHGWRVIVTHGNGPQVGFILLRSDLAADVLPLINTGIAHKEAGIGQIGAGLVRPPAICFEEALRAIRTG